MADSETPRPGWWRARDGNWYPPELLPTGWFIDTDGVAKQREPIAASQPQTSSPPTRREPLPTRKPTYTAALKPPRSFAAKAWRIAVPAIVTVVIAVAAVTAAKSTDDDDGQTKPDAPTKTDAPTTATLEAARLAAAATIPVTTLTPPPAPTPPPTTAPPPTCSATMSNAAPAQDSVVSVLVGSSQPNTPVQVTVEYRTTTLRYPGATNNSGTAAVAFSIGKATIGFTVRVDVSVGPATCSTSFTTG